MVHGCACVRCAKSTEQRRARPLCLLPALLLLRALPLSCKQLLSLLLHKTIALLVDAAMVVVVVQTMVVVVHIVLMMLVQIT